MANFKTHLTIGISGSLLGAIIGYQLNYITTAQELSFVLLTGSIGSILPDIDARQSTPTKLVFAMVSLFCMVIFIASGINEMLQHWVYKLTNRSLALVGTAACMLLFCLWIFIFVNRYLPNLLSKITHHRGFIHSVPMALCNYFFFHKLLIILGYGCAFADLLAFYLLLGYFIHLLLDELCSVNMVNMKTKSSFGTALQVFSRDKPLPYLIAYAIIGCFIWIK